jgi:hypothetical protein
VRRLGGVRRLSRLLLALVLCGLLAFGALRGLHWYASPAFASSTAACANPDTLRCKVCQLLDRTDCSAGTNVGCPEITAEYRNRFPQFKSELELSRQPLARWQSVRKDAEEAEKAKSGSLCDKYLGQIKKAAEALPDAAESKGLLSLQVFRQCSEQQIVKIKGQILDRGIKSTGILHKRLDEMVKIGIELQRMSEAYAAQSGSATALRRWVRDKIEECRT